MNRKDRVVDHECFMEDSRYVSVGLEDKMVNLIEYEDEDNMDEPVLEHPDASS